MVVIRWNAGFLALKSATGGVRLVLIVESVGSMRHDGAKARASLGDVCRKWVDGEGSKGGQSSCLGSGDVYARRRSLPMLLLSLYILYAATGSGAMEGGRDGERRNG